ncbi:hypothetical protein KBI33_00995 [Candidatus Shapirobacteria bacterium]|nr:hypothetical protein [Candidatus Shapirobacteria bacterium]
MKKKIFELITASLFFLLISASPAEAFVSSTPLGEELKKQEYQAGSSVFNTTKDTIESLNILILGSGDEELDQKLGASAIQTTNNLIASLYANPPASSAYYLADIGQRLNLTQPAYAQGVGFPGLTPLLPLWRAARNAAYIFFIFVFLVIGFAIMFRAKINPQTVVTIQSAIPKAVVALVLVTFSYAIAGLMIDLMYLIIGLMGSLLANSGLLTGNNFLNEYVGMNFFEMMGKLLKEGESSWWSIAFGVWEGMGTGKVGSKIIGAITGAIPALILGLVLLLLTFKIFFALLMAYIQIIIAIVIAPFQLMLSAIPGQNTLSSWMRNLTQNLLAFPGVISALALGGILANLSGDNLWMPPILGSSINADVVAGILSLGVLLLTAKIPDMIKSMFEKKPFAAGAAIGEALKPAKTMGKTVGLYGVETGAQYIEGAAEAAHRTTGLDLGATRVIRRVTGLKK